MEKPRALHLPWLPDGYAADVSTAREFIQLRPAESRIEFHAAFGSAAPFGPSVGLCLE